LDDDTLAKDKVKGEFTLPINTEGYSLHFASKVASLAGAKNKTASS
jgi:hypothetical protein